jgi:Cdc6-like AAA superfamily ATPase
MIRSDNTKKGVLMTKQLKQPTDVVKCTWSGNRANAFDTDGNKRTSEITTGARQKAADGGYLLGKFEMKNGKFQWRRYEGETSSPVQVSSTVEVPQEHEEILSFIHNSYGLKPKMLMMSELKWKYLVRSGVRGKNIMMTGPAGCGKTMAAKSLVNSLDRPDYYFNLGATQDPRSTLIGNTHFDSKKGTYFEQSHFVKAIQTPNSVILLDELSRAHPDAWNILMTV